MHIFHEYRNPLVPLGQSELFYEALAQAGNEVWFTSVSDPKGFHDHAIIIGASEYTVYWTNHGGQEVVWSAPDDERAPTSVNIEHFISNALNRAR